jgi:D-alanine transaminase
MQVYLNGEYLEREQAAISADDRGFLFGDGVYEVVRATSGRLIEAQRHWRRLARSLRGIMIGGPAGLDDCALSAIAQRLLEANELAGGDALIYLQITRGAAVRMHHFPEVATRPTVYASASAFQPPDALRARGAAALTVPDIRWARCDLKTVNLLPNVLAKQHAVAAGKDEAIFVRDGAVTEGSSANVFAVFESEVRTYPTSNYILPGVTRELTLEVARRLGIPVREAPVFAEELAWADEVFLTSTTNDVMPVVEVDGRPVGSGRPGPVAGRLYAALREHLIAHASQVVTR